MGCITVFSFYALTLYLNIVPITMPGMLKDDPQSVINVRYGSVMAATMPLFASLLIFAIWRQVQRRRAFSLFLLAPLLLPDPIPSASHEPMDKQFTQNLFYTEAIHNQSFWMPPFVDVASKLKANLDDGLILTNTRIVHVVVWATGIPMRRFITAATSVMTVSLCPLACSKPGPMSPITILVTREPKIFSSAA